MLLHFISFGLRGGAALAKLFFVIYLGHLNYDSLVGQFAIFATITIVFTQLAGLEINQTIGRKLHALGDYEKKSLFQHQVIASLFSYAMLSTIIVAIYYNLLGSYWVAGLMVLYLEHYTTELYRLYILNLRPLKATLLLFIKNFGWIALFVLLHYLEVVSAKIEHVLILWLGFLLLASFIGTSNIKILSDAKNLIFSKGCLGNTWRLVWSSRFFILSAVAIAFIGAIDKLLIGRFFSAEQLGGYYFYQTIASIPALIVSFSIGATLWPKCIKLAATGNEADYLILWKRLNSLYWIIIISASLAIAISIPFALKALDRSPDELSVFYLLLASSAAFALCEPHKLHLYTGGEYQALLIGNVLQLITVVVFVMTGLLLGGIDAVAAGLLSANILSFYLYRHQVPMRVAKIKSQE